MFVLTVEFEIKTENIEAFRKRIMQQAADSVEKESECHQFDVCFDPESPTACFLYEKYTDRAAFDEHLKTEHFLSFDAAVGSWIESKSVRMWRCG